METTENEKVVVPVAPNKGWRGNPRKKYDLEFKQQVVKEYASGLMSTKDLAKKYKIKSDSSIHGWVKALGGKSHRALAQGKGTKGHTPRPVEYKAPVGATVEKTEGRMDLYIKSDRAMLLQVIGEQYLEIRRLEAKKSA